MKKILQEWHLIAFVCMIGSLVACDSSSTDLGPDSITSNVGVQFETVTGEANKAAASAENDTLTIEGSNGTLRIDDIRFIVAEFELEREDDDKNGDDNNGDDDNGDDDDEQWEEFELEPFFVDLPLTNDEVISIGDSDIPGGLYEELEFEIEDLELNDGEDEEAYGDLAEAIRSEFDDWPDDASMIISGTFTSSEGDERPFKVYADAEIEIEREFEPALEITSDDIEKMLSVRINPARWFERSDGTVLDLSQYDWDETDDLLEFSAEFEDGVEEIEIDD